MINTTFKTIKLIVSILFIQSIFYFSANLSYAAEPYKKLSCIIHLHSSQFSSEGENTLSEIAKSAQDNNIDVIIPCDQALMKWEYGILPFGRFLKASINLTSILKLGPEKYISELARIEKYNKNLIVIPGSEVTPFYFWSGKLFNENFKNMTASEIIRESLNYIFGDHSIPQFLTGLTIHDRNKHFLIVGPENPDFYTKLPIVSNSHAGSFNFLLLWPVLLMIPILFTRNNTTFSIFLLLFGLLILLINYPFKTSVLNPNLGPQGEKPYQDLINYSQEKDALVFIAHPEAYNYKEPTKKGPVFIETKPYPESILNLHNYDGFAIYAEGMKAGSIGSYWDQALLEYCLGERKRPVWAIGELDYTRDTNRLNKISNILFVREKNKAAVLKALKHGNFIAQGWGIPVEDFSITSGSKFAICGDEIEYQKPIKIHIKINPLNNKKYPIKANIIRNGKLLGVIETNIPTQLIYEDKQDLPKGKNYYRIEINNKVFTNPVFVIKR